MNAGCAIAGAHNKIDATRTNNGVPSLNREYPSGSFRGAGQTFSRTISVYFVSNSRPGRTSLLPTTLLLNIIWIGTPVLVNLIDINPIYTTQPCSLNCLTSRNVAQCVWARQSAKASNLARQDPSCGPERSLFTQVLPCALAMGMRSRDTKVRAVCRSRRFNDCRDAAGRMNTAHLNRNCRTA